MQPDDAQTFKQRLDSIAAVVPPPVMLLEAVHRRRRRRRVATVVGSISTVVIMALLTFVGLRLGLSNGKGSQNDSVPAAGIPISPPSGFATAVSAGRLTNHVANYLFTSIQLDPPASTLTPAVNAVSAYADCATAGNAHCDQTHGPSMLFALASSDIGGTVQADGTVKRALNRSPVWVLTWNLTCVPESGGPLTNLQASAEPGPTPRPCTRVAVVDATTGTYISTEQDIPN